MSYLLKELRFEFIRCLGCIWPPCVLGFLYAIVWIASRESCLVLLHVIAMAWAPVSTTFRNQGTQIWQKSQNRKDGSSSELRKKDIFLKTNWRNWSQSKYINYTPNFKSFEIHLRIAAYYQIKLKRRSIYQNWHFCNN